MKRENFSSGAPWEAIVGYSRVVRTGPFITVAGTTATDAEGRVLARGDVREQTVIILKKIQAALQKSGARMEDVVRTRLFVTNIEEWKVIGRAHGEFFANIRPACTMVEVKQLVDPEMLLEIEADAIVSEE